MDFTQSSFIGGLDNNIDPTKLSPESYYLGINVRNRQSNLQPIRKPLNLSDKIPEGNLQGIFGAGTLLLLFINGEPYIRDVSVEDTGFVRLIGATALDPDVPYIFAEFVPGSTIGFGRVNAPIEYVAGNVAVEDNVTFNRELPFNTSVQGVIYQDGLNQGNFILSGEGVIRKAQDYGQWTVGNREYLPKMRQMLYYGGILFGISADGKDIFHSVSGRPLDFVVAIDQTGNKEGPETEGGAPGVSWKVDFEALTAIRPTPTQDVLAVTTLNKSFLLQLLTEENSLIYGEPDYSAFQVAAIGAVNHLCFADLNGDTAIINTKGIHSFNAAKIVKTESANDPISGKVNRLFELDEDHFVAQDYPCAHNFGADYSLFAVNTIYGRGVLVYDKIAQAFVSLDMYSGVGQIKQFADIVVNGRRRLFFITTDNQLFEGFAGDGTETAAILPAEWASGDPTAMQKPGYMHLIFSECEENGTVSITPIVNRQHFNPKTEALKALVSEPVLPITPPFGGETNRTTQVVTFNLDTIPAGWKVGFFIQWNVKAQLTHIMLNSAANVSDVAETTKARRYGQLTV
jgi:hypothetical protein